MIDPRPCIKAYLAHAHCPAVPQAEGIGALEYLDPLMGAPLVRLVIAQLSGEAPVAIGVANLLNERELHDLHPPNKKRRRARVGVAASV